MSLKREIVKVLSALPSDLASSAGYGGPPSPVAEGFESLRDDFRIRFGTRAPGSYEIQHNLEIVFTSKPTGDIRGKLPYIQFEPADYEGDEHVPVLVVHLLFSANEGGVYLLLSDLRMPGKGPGESIKSEQRKQLRSLLQSESSLAWNKQYWGAPDRLVEHVDEGGWFASATILYKYWDRENVPHDDELARDIDAILRLRELYVERFAERATFSSFDRSLEAEVGAEGRATTRPDSKPSGSPRRETGDPPTAKNVILYGPPGTGKTYSTTRRTLELCDEIDEGEELSGEDMRQKFHQLQEAGRVEFVTFHQSYGYEEFVESIRPKIQGGDSKKGDVTDEGEIEYEYKKGAFKRIALAAASEGLYLTSHDQAFEQRWTGLHRAIEDDEVREAKSSTGLSYRISIIDSETLRLERVDEDNPNPTSYKVKKTGVKKWWNHRDELGRDYKAIDSDRASSVIERPGMYTPHWIVYRELSELEDVELPQEHESRVAESEDYESRLVSAENYLQERPRNLFHSFDRAEPYVLIIDEINRGNISKILGELITLLEPSKRLTCDDEMIVTLPHTEDKFAVPPNLHIIGTMNTADRSIALLDAALRRRFEYEEMMPDSSIVVEGLLDAFEADEIGELEDEEKYLVNLAPALLDTINERIRFLYDRDHQIGHSYFMMATSLEELRTAFVDRVIPLLQEYFYGTWNQIGLALGCPYDRKSKPKRKKGKDPHAFGEDGYLAPMVKADVLDEKEILRMDHEDYENQADWRVHPHFADPSRIDGEDVGNRLKEFFEAVLPSKRCSDVTAGDYAEQVYERGGQS